MTITQGGTLPVSGINLGLVASVSGLQAEVTKLQLDVSNITPALEAQASISLDFPPDPLSYVASFAAEVAPLEVAAQLVPATVTAASVDQNVELALELGVIEAQLAVVQEVATTVGAGLAAGELSGWSYAGRALGLGETLDLATSSGFGRTALATTIRAVIIGTESFASWQAFSGGVNTGTSADAEVTASDARLQFMGTLGGGEWNTGAFDLFGRIQLLLDQLEALRAIIIAQIDLTIGIGLPDVQVIVDGAVDVIAEFGVDGLLDSFVNVDVDINASLGFLNAKIEFLLNLIAEIGGDLSAGGLTIWFYEGPASQLGLALRGELTNGLPGGSGAAAPIYGLVIAGPEQAMLTFGTIFKTS